MLRKLTKAALCAMRFTSRWSVVTFLPLLLASGSKLGWTQSPLDPAIDAKVKILRDKSQRAEDRQSVSLFLGHLNPAPQSVVQALTGVLRDRSEQGQVRIAAVEALATIGQAPSEAESVLSAFAQTLRKEPTSQNVAVRAAVARALGRIGPSYSQQRPSITHQAVQILTQVLTGPKENAIVRSNSAWALGQLGDSITGSDVDDTVEALIAVVRITPVNVGQSAANSLQKIHQRAASRLEGQLSDPDPSFRWNVAWILGEIGTDAKDAVLFLTSLLKDSREDPNVRGAAAWAIGKVGREAKAGTANFPDTVSALSAALNNKDEDPNVRSNAAWALGRLGPDIKKVNQSSSDPITKSFRDAIRDQDGDIRRNAAWALGQVDPDARIAVPPLVAALNIHSEQDPRVRTEAAAALGQIRLLGQQVHEAVQGLRDALADDNSAVRMGAARALGQIGEDAESAINQLVETSHKSRKPVLRPEEEDARRAAAEAVVRIASVLETGGKIDATERLQAAASAIRQNGYGDDADRIAFDAAKLRSLRFYNHIANFLVWIQQHRLPVFLIGAYVSSWLVLYWWFPSWIFRINERMKPYAGYKLPKLLGGIPLSYFILGGFFHYRPRVLDAWVAVRIKGVRRKFQSKTTVTQREVHVDLPVFLDGKSVSALRADHLRSCFERKRSCVLIVGEGGSGKTSLACQICKWVMEGQADGISPRPLLAVLLEQENLEGKNGRDFLLEAVRIELWHLTDSADVPSAELVQKLLETKRILVVIDGLSEMTEVRRSRIQPSDSNFPAHALVMTSRVELSPAGIDLTVIKPMRVQGDRLSTFMDAYLVQRNAKQDFSDAEYFDCLGKLSRIVGEREITVLLAKMYAEQMIAAKEAACGTRLPENIPDLVLEYLNELNRRVRRNRLDDRVVHRDAKVIAWECLNQTYRPMTGSIEKILQQMDPQPASPPEERLKYLEDRLRLVQTIGAGRDRVRFSLDPLAEYLAALRCVETFSGDEQRWRRFLADGDLSPGAPEMIRGFLLAVRDCCIAKEKEVGIPSFVVYELNKRACQDSKDNSPVDLSENQAEAERSSVV